MICVSDEERNCAYDLKKLCFKNGREKNSKETGKIMHQLATIYKNQAIENKDTGVGKINFIQSAALLNAAIFREPDNILEIKENLRQLCKDLLVCANAENSDSDLLIATAGIMYEVKSLRSEAQSKLKNINLIPENTDDSTFYEQMKQKSTQIKQLQFNVSKTFTRIMKILCDYCVAVVGELPCNFSLVALGSLVRKEVTPFSDMESVIVLEEGIQSSPNYDKVLEYFRWLACIFQVVLINLGETIVPCVDIQSINGGKHAVFKFYDAVTPRGISSDGMVPYACKNPLGRQFGTEKKPFAMELIKPVSEMVELLNTDQDLKNGYHLADMIAESCYVSGDVKVYDHFQKLVKKEVPKLKAKFIESFDSFQDFDIFDNLLKIGLHSTLNLKRGVYRSSTLFISALGRMHGLSGLSCFEVIEQLYNKSYVSFRDKEFLLFAIAVACEARLRIYLKKNGQDNLMEHSDSVAEIVDAVGIKSLIYYFMITKVLQKCMNDKMFLKKSNVNRIIIVKEMYTWIGYQLRHYDSVLNEGKPRLDSFSSFTYANYSVLAESLIKRNEKEECLNVLNEWNSITKKSKDTLEKCENLDFISETFLKIDQHNKALACLRLSLDVKTRMSSNPTKDENVAEAYNKIGSFWAKVKDFEAALLHFNKALKIAKKVSPKSTKLDLLQETYDNIGLCEFSLQDFSGALKSYQKRLEIIEEQNCPLKKCTEVTENVAMAFRNVGQPEMALPYFFKCLKNWKQMTTDQTKDEKVAGAYENIAVTKSNLNEHAEALKYYQKSLAIFKVLSLNEKNDVKLAGLYDNIGICLSKLDETNKALDYFYMALEIYDLAEKLFENEKNVGKVYFNIGNCMIDLQELNRAIDYFKKSLNIKKQFTLDEQHDNKIKDVYSNIGVCFFRLNNYDQSSIYFRQALSILVNLSRNPNFDPEIIKMCKFINSLESSLFWKYVEPIVVYKTT